MGRPRDAAGKWNAMHMAPDTDHAHAPRHPSGRERLAGRLAAGRIPPRALALPLAARRRVGRWRRVVAYLIALTLTPRFEASAVLMVTASKTGEQVASGLDVRNFRAFVQNQHARRRGDQGIRR